MADNHGSPGFAERLDQLFDEVRSQAGRRYTNDEVAAAMRAVNPDLRVSGAYLSALRKGSKSNPSHELLRGLARHFGVSVSFFFGPPANGQSAFDDELARVAGNQGVQRLALRALDLSPEGLAAAMKAVESILESDRDHASRPDTSPPT